MRSKVAEAHENTETSLKAVNAKAKYLKEALEKVEVERARANANEALKRNWRKAAEVKVVEAEKKAKGQIIEAGHLAMEAFKASPEFTKIKVEFSMVSFEDGQEVCCQKITKHHLERDLSFLDEKADDLPMMDEPTVAEEPSSKPTAEVPVLETFEV
ncbi:hypothetical protein COCNU_scaffold018388G000020 [Cocos nucifera]|nr:hypothetical protein [Cocos nucifera]